MIGNCFAMRLRGTTTTNLSAYGNSRNELLLIDSIILSQQTHVHQQRTYLTLIAFIMKALCIPVGASTIPVILLEIQRSAQYRISRSLLIRLMILTIRLQSKLNYREGVIIGCKGVTNIVFYLMGRDVWRWFSGTSMNVRLGFGGGHTTVNRMSVIALNWVMTHSFVSLGMSDFLLFHNNEDCLWYQLAAMMNFMHKRLYKSYDPI